MNFEDRLVGLETMDMGIVRGAEIQRGRDAPLGDPLEFLLREYNLTLRREEAKTIW